MSDAAELRAMAQRVRAIGASRTCIGNELVVMATVDLGEALDTLAGWVDRDDELAIQEFAAEAPTAPASLITRPGVGT